MIVLYNRNLTNLS